MENALGQPQTIVLFGGTSDIGLAIVRQLLNPTTRTVVLACRDIERGERAAAGLAPRFAGRRRGRVRGDRHRVARRPGALAGEQVRRHRRCDHRVRAARRREPSRRSTPAAAAELAQVNFTGVVSSTIAVANQMRQQGHGSIVMLSSVAGERVRRANPVYGGTKAGIDGFAQGLGDALVDDGVHMLIVRPGFVTSSMTAGLKPAPFATTPEKVADATVKGLRRQAPHRVGTGHPPLRFFGVAPHARPGVETPAPWLTTRFPTFNSSPTR